jgi:hypothetical protein
MSIKKNFEVIEDMSKSKCTLNPMIGLFKVYYLHGCKAVLLQIRNDLNEGISPIESISNVDDSLKEIEKEMEGILRDFINAK